MAKNWKGKKISNVFVSQEPALHTKKKCDKPADIFQDTLKTVGFIAATKNDPNELDVDQAVFTRELTKILNDANSPQIVEKFVSGFETYLEDEVRLKWSLMPTVTTATCETARNASQDSLVHLLLNIEIIQEKIASIMLDKLAEFSYAENSILYDRSENKSVACLIVSQFRWLNKLVNSEALTDKLIELIEATPLEVQTDIIKLIPDVISECDHSKVAKSLGDFLRGNQELNVTILDALTNLNVDSDLLSEIRIKETEMISSAKVCDLPVIVKFILQDLSPSEASEIINELRNNLDFNSTFNPIISSTPINPKIRESSKDIASSLLNTIKHSLKFQKTLCDAWIKLLESLQGTQAHKSLDILVILALISLEVSEKKLENIMKTKIKAGDLNEDLLHVTFRCHHDIMQEYAPVLFKLAELLLRCSESSLSIFGCSLYSKCFIWFDTFYKQEVIGSLITHVGNKSENETNAALGTLLSLVQQHTQKMAPYSVFVKTLIDHLDELTLNQIRKVHETLSILAYQGGREGTMLLDDILIVIRKQLTSRNIKYRKMGVIGALMAAKTAAAKENDECIADASSSDILDNTTCYQHSIKLLELVAESTSDSSEAFALFCDELSLIMLQKQIGKTVLEWVGERILSEFEDHYIIDINPDENNGQNICPRYTLDVVNEPVALNLYNIVLKSTNKFKFHTPVHNTSLRKHKFDVANESRLLSSLLKISNLSENTKAENENLVSSVKLAPIFRLLRIFKQIQDGNLDSIDALLGCPIMLPELRNLKLNSLDVSEQHLMLDTLFYCINWIREIINAFAATTDNDRKCNVLTRLQLLVEMEELVCLYINQVHDYMPPMANFDCDHVRFNTLKLPSKKPQKRTVKDKGKKSKKAKSDIEIAQSTLNGSKNSSKSTDSDDDFEVKDVSDTSLLKKLLPYFREFDFEVFSLFKTDISFHNRVDVFSNEKVTSLKIHPKEVKFLLEDLQMKLHHCFGTSIMNCKITPKKSGFSNLESLASEEVILHCIELLPSLCSVLEACATYFKKIKEECDGVEDSLLLFTKDSQYVMDCMNLTFKIMNLILSWKSLNLKENLSILKKIIIAFAIRLDASIEDIPLNELITLAINYFNLFTNSVPTLLCAANFVHLLASFINFTDDDETKKKVSVIAVKFLKKLWTEFNVKHPKTALINENVKILLEAYLTSNKEVLKSLEYLAAEAIPQILSDDNEKVFNTLTKGSLIWYYKIMFRRLSDYMKIYFMKKQKDDDKLYQWSTAIKIFQVLTNLIKTFGGRLHIATCLKYSREFMATFLKHGMPLMDKLLMSKKDDVICLMKTLQVSTRYLQHVCSHSKVLKDVSLISHVPFLKKSLEVFVFRVKMMLAVHKCEEAFWLGNLKNRDLKGTEIESQETETTDAESETQDDDTDETKSDAEGSGIESETEDN